MLIAIIITVEVYISTVNCDGWHCCYLLLKLKAILILAFAISNAKVNVVAIDALVVTCRCFLVLYSMVMPELEWNDKPCKCPRHKAFKEVRGHAPPEKF